MPNAQPNSSPEELSKIKGKEKTGESKLNSPDAVDALKKESGNRIIESSLAHLPQTRDVWLSSPPETENQPESEESEKEESEDELPKTRPSW